MALGEARDATENLAADGGEGVCVCYLGGRDWGAGWGGVQAGDGDCGEGFVGGGAGGGGGGGSGWVELVGGAGRIAGGRLLVGGG